MIHRVMSIATIYYASLQAKLRAQYSSYHLSYYYKDFISLLDFCYSQIKSVYIIE